jgi:hypothetical protein
MTGVLGKVAATSNLAVPETTDATVSI